MPDSSPETYECTRCAATGGPRRCTDALCRVHDPDPKVLEAIPRAGTYAVAHAWWEWDQLERAVDHAARAQLSRGVDVRHVSRLRRGAERLRIRAEALTEGVVAGALPDDPGARLWLKAWAVRHLAEHDIDRTYPIGAGLDQYHACCVSEASAPCRHSPSGLPQGETEVVEPGSLTLLARVVIDMCSRTTYNAYLVVEGFILDWMASAYGQPSVPTLCQMVADWVGRQETIDSFTLEVAPGDTGSPTIQARLTAPSETWKAWQYGVEAPGYLKPVLPTRPVAHRRA